MINILHFGPWGGALYVNKKGQMRFKVLNIYVYYMRYALIHVISMHYAQSIFASPNTILYSLFGLGKET
jgi:hypothetical protein